MTKYAIIDTSNLFYRCMFAAQADAFTKAGMALHIIFRSLRKLHREMSVDHMVFCVEGRSWRNEVFPAYKRKRKLERMAQSEREKEDGEVFFSIMNDLVDYISTQTNCSVLQSEGVEGDDFVARWVQLHPDDEHVILSGDSDFIQLLASNVTIVDGANERIITCDKVTNYKGELQVFSIDPSKGRLKVSGTLEEAIAKHDKAERERKKAAKAAGATYEKIEFAFTPEPEWWRNALFIKLVRGDVTDGIFSAYPGVRYLGTKKKIGINEAWEDRREQGYAWNNFMLQTWERGVGADDDGGMLTETVKVADAYAFNETLIDLTKQPADVQELMDTVIIQAVQKPVAKMVGIGFMRFCNAQELPRLSNEASDHSAYLALRYAKT